LRAEQQVGVGVVAVGQDVRVGLEDLRQVCQPERCLVEDLLDRLLLVDQPRRDRRQRVDVVREGAAVVRDK